MEVPRHPGTQKLHCTPPSAFYCSGTGAACVEGGEVAQGAEDTVEGVFG